VGKNAVWISPARHRRLCPCRPLMKKAIRPVVFESSAKPCIIRGYDENAFFFGVLMLGFALLAAARPAGRVHRGGRGPTSIPPFAELTQTTLLLGGIDIHENPGARRLHQAHVLRPSTRKNYKDDFAWHDIEKQILSRVTTRKEYFRSLFQVGGRGHARQTTTSPTSSSPLTPRTLVQETSGYMVLLSEEHFKPYCVFSDPLTGAPDQRGTARYSRKTSTSS